MGQLSIFFCLAYLISWTLWLPLYSPVLGFTFEYSVKYLHAIGAIGPLIASLICTWIFDGSENLKNLIRAFFTTSKISFLLIALLSPFLLNIIVVGIYYFQTGNLEDLSKVGLTREFPEFNAISFFFYNLLFFGYGEETGWRGFALPRLQRTFNALNASLTLAFFWAIWHWPLFFYRPGYTGMDMPGILGWGLSLLTGSILLTWLFNSSRGSILVCAIFHSAIDVAFTSDYLDKNMVGLMGMLITIWGIVVVFVFKPANLSRTSRVIRS